MPNISVNAVRNPMVEHSRKPSRQRSRRPRGVRAKPAPVSAATTAAWSRSCVRRQHRLAVDLLDQQRLHTARADQIGEGPGGGMVGFRVVGEGEQRAPTALEEPGKFTVDEGHQGTGLAARPVGALGPRQGGAVRVGGIGGRQHHGLVLLALRIDAVEIGPQPIDRRCDRELGAAKRLDEVPALTPAGVLECGQHLVEHREPTGNALGRDRALRQHAVAVEQQLGLKVRPHSRIQLGGG